MRKESKICQRNIAACHTETTINDFGNSFLQKF